MKTAGPLRHPYVFLGLFALVTALSLPAWEVVSGYYLAGIVELVNGALTLAIPGSPLRLPQSDSHQVVYPGIAGAMALFLVTPRRSLRWKLRWLVIMLGGLCLLHTAVLLLSTLSLVARETAPPVLVRVATSWGTSVLVIWLWFAAVRQGMPRTEPESQ